MTNRLYVFDTYKFWACEDQCINNTSGPFQRDFWETFSLCHTQSGDESQRELQRGSTSMVQNCRWLLPVIPLLADKIELRSPGRQFYFQYQHFRAHGDCIANHSCNSKSTHEHRIGAMHLFPDSFCFGFTSLPGMSQCTAPESD